MLDNTPSGFGDLLSICVDKAPSVGFRLCQSFSSLSEALKYPSTRLFITHLEQQQQQHFIHISITGFVKLIE